MTTVERTDRNGTGQPNREGGRRQTLSAIVVRHSAGRNKAMVQYLKAWFDLHTASEEEGQGLVEYALILVLISVAAIVTMSALSGSVQGVFTSISGTLDGAV